MRVLLLFFLLINIFILGVFFSKIEFEVFFNQQFGLKKSEKANFKILIRMYLFYKIKIFKINLYNKKSKKPNKQFKFDREIFLILKNLKLKIEKLNFNIDLDTQNIFVTTFLVVIISTVISNILAINVKSNCLSKYKYSVNTNYQNNNCINIKLNSIITGDFVHISNIVYKLLLKMRRESNERSSN